jgi:hypothetical protein
MSFIKLSSLINGLGLILDIIGVLLMFEKVNVATYLYRRDEIEGVNKKKNRILNTGLWLLLMGFLLQLISLFF